MELTAMARLKKLLIVLAVLTVIGVVAFLLASALSADVGIAFAPGSPTSWRPSGAATFHPECSPFNAAGELAVSRFGPEWACRYTGGDVEATTATPRCGAEWEPHASGALRAWCEAGRPRDGSLPGGAQVLPVASPGCAPSARELVDVIYSPDCFAFISEWVWARAGDPAGKSAETPMATCRTDWPWVYAAEPHVQYPTYVYFRNTCRPEGEVSYAPARRQKDAQGREYGPRIPAYPQVFGPPTAAAGGSSGTSGGGSSPQPTELERLRAENAQLRTRLAEAERLGGRHPYSRPELRVEEIRAALLRPAAGGGVVADQLAIPGLAGLLRGRWGDVKPLAVQALVALRTLRYSIGIDPRKPEVP